MPDSVLHILCTIGIHTRLFANWTMHLQQNIYYENICCLDNDPPASFLVGQHVFVVGQGVLCFQPIPLLKSGTPSRCPRSRLLVSSQTPSSAPSHTATLVRTIPPSPESTSAGEYLKIELVTPLERRYITPSNSVKILHLAHTQPKLFNTKHAWGRKVQTEKNTFDIRIHGPVSI